jgi:hypothetical protein
MANKIQLTSVIYAVRKELSHCLRDKRGQLAESNDVKVTYKPGGVSTSIFLLEAHQSSRVFLAFIVLVLSEPTPYQLVHISRYIELCDMFVYSISIILLLLSINVEMQIKMRFTSYLFAAIVTFGYTTSALSVPSQLRERECSEFPCGISEDVDGAVPTPGIFI